MPQVLLLPSLVVGAGGGELRAWRGQEGNGAGV